MTWATISTWRMSFNGLKEASRLLNEGKPAGDAVEKLINMVELFPNYKSVGYGGLPNEDGVVQMDAGFMDGDTLAQGSVAAIENVKKAVSVARQLSKNTTNSFLAGPGATKFAMQNGFEMTNMLTDNAKSTWKQRLKEHPQSKLTAYNGHDTVGAVALDQEESMAAATSTSGLFMKKDGRIGDSPLSGSGFYADSQIGGAAATGLGEDIMKGCLSYEIVRKMEEGLSPQEAADQTLFPFVNKLTTRYGACDAISLIALNKNGEWGVATNVDFAFCVANDHEKPKIMIAKLTDHEVTKIFPMSEEWIKSYEKTNHTTID